MPSPVSAHCVDKLENSVPRLCVGGGSGSGSKIMACTTIGTEEQPSFIESMRFCVHVHSLRYNQKQLKIEIKDIHIEDEQSA